MMSRRARVSVSSLSCLFFAACCSSLVRLVSSADAWTLDDAGLIEAPDSGWDHRFGASFVIDPVDGSVVVGEPGHGDDSVKNHSGAALVYEKAGGSWTVRQRLEPPDGAQEYSWFGVEMAIDRDTLAIGELGWDDASRDVTDFFGAVSVYARSKNNKWELEQHIKSPQSRSDDDHFFGRGLALAEDTLVVGASRVDVNGHSRAGAAYVYVRVGQRWSLAHTLTAPDAGERHYFGKRVAIDRDVIVVSAPRWSASTLGGTYNGKVYVYRKTSQSPSPRWSLEEELTAPESYNDEFTFGNRIALRDYELVVSARGYDTNATHGNYVGKVYVYSGSEAYQGWGLWQQSDGSNGLTAPDGEYDYHEFGYGLAFDGEVIAVGSLDHANPNANGVNYDIFRGSVYVFRRNKPSAGNNDFVLEQQITVVDRSVNNHYFGQRIFLQGSKLAVSSIGMSNPPNVDTGAANYVGSVYVFDGPSDEKSTPLKVIVPVVAGVGAVIVVVVTLTFAYFRRIWCFKDRTRAPKIIQLGGSKVLMRRGVHSRPAVGFAPTQNSPGVVFEGGQQPRAVPARSAAPTVVVNEAPPPAEATTEAEAHPATNEQQ